MLTQAKRLALRAADASGISSLTLSSRWRRSRLLILCYHGVALEDEHRWEPGLYLSAAVFRARMERLRELDCSILPLGEAVERLYGGSLPPRAVALTFDDGFYDFHRVAWPVLKEFSWPATVYLTTYYVDRNWPIFDLMCSYLLWKSRQPALNWPEVFASPVMLDKPGRTRAVSTLFEYCLKQRLSGGDKNVLLEDLAGRLIVDLGEISRKRILHLMNGDEIRAAASGGVDFQLHTHRHRVFRRRERFWQEIDENRERIAALTGRSPVHFCYPGGYLLPDFPAWLRERGVNSATTCRAGLAAPDSDPMLLPRALDSNSLTRRGFDAWVTGIAALLPKRYYSVNENQLLEEDLPLAPHSIQ